MTVTPSDSPIAPVLHELNRLLTELRALLSEEQRHVGRRDVDALLPLLDQKSRLIRNVETLDAQRRGLVCDSGNQDTRKGMDAFLRLQADGPQLTTMWTDILSLLEECRALNESNGAIIHQSMAMNERMLNVFRGASADETTAYGPEGTRNSPRGSRNLGKA